MNSGQTMADETLAHQPRAWTAAQRTAMEHAQGDMLVMAGAGSGKTAVLSQRCVRLVTQAIDPCGVDELLVVTFTEAAANEMRGRIAASLRSTAETLARSHPQDAHRLLEQAALVDQAQISTLHSFCAKTLRLWFHQCDLDCAFEILDEHEGRLLFSQALQTVLDRRLVRTDESGKLLAHFFDVYANSNIRQLEKFVARLEQTWELTPDPRQWLARAVAASADATAMRRMFQAVQAQLQTLADALAPFVAQPAFVADPKGQMHQAVCELNDLLAVGIMELNSVSASAWLSVEQKLTGFQWPARIVFGRNVADDDEARRFKASVYDKLKKQLAALTENSYAAPLPTRLQWDQQLAEMSLALLDFYDDVRAEFQALKKTAGRVSFADLERRLLDALETPGSPVAADLQRRYRHVLVDEYQDINPVQQRLLSRICRGETAGSFFTVGDALQSIYGFRGGEPGLLLRRAATLRALPASPNGLVEMTENFRTLPNLLDAMNLIFQRLFAQLPPDAGVSTVPPLRHGRPAPTAAADILTGSPIELLVVVTEPTPIAAATPNGTTSADESDFDESRRPGETTDDFADSADDGLESVDTAVEDMAKARKEALRLVGHIRQLIAENKLSQSAGKIPRAITYSDIAILLRSPRFQAQEFVRVFLENGIPAQSAMTTGYFAAPEIQEILALLEVLDNPFQDISLAAALLGPLGRFSYDDLAAIRMEFPPSRQLPFHQAVFRAMFHPVVAAAAQPAMAADLPGRLKAFFQKLDGWRAAIRTLGVPEGLAQIYQESGLLIWSAGLPYGRQRVANLQMLYQRAVEFSRFQRQGLGRFLTFLRDLQDQDIDLGIAPVATAGDDAIRIMSIHKSKGLEFPVVILAGLGTRFNERERNNSYLVDRENGLGFIYKDPHTGVRWLSPQYQQIRTAAHHRLLAEEARLLYVAMTRARDKLILVGSVNQKKADQRWSLSAPRTTVQCPLDWLAPIFAAENTPALASTIETATAAAAPFPATDTPSGVADAAVASTAQLTAVVLQQIRTGQPSESVAAGEDQFAPQPADPTVSALVDRLTRAYPWQPLTLLPAVTKVTELKSQIRPDTDESPAVEIPAATRHSAAQLPETTENPAIQRGIAVHRLLQLLDFTGPLDEAGIGRQLAALVARHLFSMEDAALIDAAAVAWIFQTSIGKQIIAVAAAKGVGNSPGVRYVHRELPFLWSMEPHFLADASPKLVSPGTNPADRVLVRGVIDLLLVTPGELHIVDYKTDMASQIETRLPMYGRQVRYYAQAVAAILGRPVTHATLMFVSAQKVKSVEL